MQQPINIRIEENNGIGQVTVEGLDVALSSAYGPENTEMFRAGIRRFSSPQVAEEQLKGDISRLLQDLCELCKEHSIAAEMVAEAEAAQGEAGLNA